MRHLKFKFSSSLILLIGVLFKNLMLFYNLFFSQKFVTGPPITLTSKISGVEVLKHTNGSLPQGPFVMKTPSLSVYNQRLWLIAVVLTDNKDGRYYAPTIYYIL